VPDLHAAQARVNDALWSRDLVHLYATDALRPVERMLIDEYGADLTGRVLELGCGAGRLTAPLAELSDRVTALDVSPAMVRATAARCPTVTVVVADLRALPPLGPFEAVVAGANVIDVLGDESRLRLLSDLRALLVPGGLLLLSSHNLGAATERALRLSVLARGRRHLISSAARLPWWWWNRRQRRRFEWRAADTAVLNDVSHDYQALHYYVTRDAMQRQLEAAGFELVDCRDLDGGVVPPGDAAADCLELHYLARPV
jgi:SAM-dependent methyltransferase